MGVSFDIGYGLDDMHIKNKVGKIYALTDPRYFDFMRYVGQTTVSLELRLKGHLKDKAITQKTIWIKKLASLGLKPKIVLLQYNIAVPFVTYLQIGNKWRAEYDTNTLDISEEYFVTQIREECEQCGLRCVNGTEKGNWGKFICKEARKRQSEIIKNRKHSEERKRHISEAVKNSKKFQTIIKSEKHSQNLKNASKKRWENQNEHIKMSRAMSGRKLSDIHKSHISESNKIAQNKLETKNAKRKALLGKKYRKLTEKERKYISDRVKETLAKPEIKDKMKEAKRGKHYPKISEAKKGQTPWNKGLSSNTNSQNYDKRIANISKKVGDILRDKPGRRWSEEEKQRARKPKTESHKLKISLAKLGKPHPKRCGYKVSKEGKHRMRISALIRGYLEYFK